MIRQTDNMFTSYLMNEEDELESAILTISQHQAIQNELAKIAQEKLLISFDPAKPEQFVQQESYLRGQLDILAYLLEKSEAAKLSKTQPQT